MMRRISCLGMEDSMFKTREESLQHPSHIFDDMSVNDVAIDMQDLLSVASDPTDNGVERLDAAVVKTVNATSSPLSKSRRPKTSHSSFGISKDTSRCGGGDPGEVDNHSEHDQNQQSIQSLTVDDLVGAWGSTSHTSSPRQYGNRRRHGKVDRSRELALPALERSLCVQKKSIQSHSSDREKVETFHESLCSLMSSSQSLSLSASEDIQHGSHVEYSPPMQCKDFGGSNSDVLILMTISRSLTEQLSLSKESFTSRPSRPVSNQRRHRTETSEHGSCAPSLCDTSARAVFPLYQSPAPGTTERVVAYERRALPSLGELFQYP
jgi:hypothetical protein